MGKIKVLLTKHMMEAHDRGLKTVLHGLKENGMEVVYARYWLPEDVVKTAMEEDVQVIGMSSSAGGHMYGVGEITRELKEKNMDNVLIILGGIIQKKEEPELMEMGVSKIFGPGTYIHEIVDHIVKNV